MVSFENIAWASLFFLAPLDAFITQLKYYQKHFKLLLRLPLVHILAEMRSILMNNVVNYANILKSISISEYILY